MSDTNNQHEDDKAMNDGVNDNETGVLEEDDILQIIELNDEDNIIPDDNEAAPSDAMEADDTMSNDENMYDDIADNAVVQFQSHSSDVFVVDISSAGLVASGGQDDKAYVWNWSGDKVNLCYTCTTHTDSVICVRFNASGTKLATGDMTGRICIWNVTDMTNIVMHTEFNDSTDLEWMQWHHAADILFAGAADGHIWMWLITPDAQSCTCKVYPPAINSACTAGRLLSDGKHLFAGYANGKRCMWDLKTQQSQYIDAGASEPQCTTNVTAIDIHKTRPISVSCDSNGNTLVVHTDTLKVMKFLAPPAMPTKLEQPMTENASDADEDFSIECVSINDDATLFATGDVNGRVCIYQIDNWSLRCICEHGAAVVKVLWLSNAFLLITASVDGVVRIWDVRQSDAPIHVLTGHTADIYDLCLGKVNQHQYAITASADHTCRVFDFSDLLQ